MVALVSERPELATPTARRLRRSRRLDVMEVGLDQIRRGTRLSHPDGLHAPLVAAVLAIGTGEHRHRSLVEELVRSASPLPLIVVSPTRPEASLALVEAGADEVLSLHDTTSASLERAVLSAVCRRSADQRSNHHANDPLTGLATRSVLDTELPEVLRSGAAQVALLYCDLDRFKLVNDTHGHATGDLLLVEAARRLREAVRASDLVVRIGGDEFVVVLLGSGSDFEGLADDVANRIVEAFRVPFELDQQTLAVSVSVGLATHRRGEDAASLLARADRALYLAKRRGKARVARYDKSLDRAEAQHASSAELLREGIRRDLLEVEILPVLDPETASMVGRVHRPVWGAAAERIGRPMQLRPVAEVARDCGSAPALFRWLLRKALVGGAGREVHLGGDRRWIDMPRSVLVGSAGAMLDAAAATAATPLDSLVVLIEEEDLGDSISLRTGFLELARRGVRVAVSHFGATTGSLGLLERHPFDAVWVDRQMLDGLADCRVRQAKLSAIGQVATALGQQLLIDRPRRVEDLGVATELVRVQVVDRPLDLTLEGVVSPLPGTRPDAPRLLDRQ
jgi:diguanylate cyclase (GGDEF)-like protein